MSFIVLAVAGVVFFLFGGLLFDGMALFWCRLISSGIVAVFLVTWFVYDVRQLGSESSGDGRSGRTSGKRSRAATVAELAILALATAAMTYSCALCLMDLPQLSSLQVAHLSNANCRTGGNARGIFALTIDGIDDDTGEKVSFVASQRNFDDFDAAHQKKSAYVFLNATVQYLPNSHIVLSADF
ncbi:MAG: hypothetical protein ACOX69_01965 [Coriobacteriales bacterium]